MLGTEDYDPINEYARIKWEELNNNIEANHSNYFTKLETREILFGMTNKFINELNISFDEEDKNFVLNILLKLYDYKIDILDIIYYINWAFTLCCIDNKEKVSIDEFLSVIELSYLDDSIKKEILNKLRKERKNIKKTNNIVTMVFNKS